MPDRNPDAATRSSEAAAPGAPGSEAAAPARAKNVAIHGLYVGATHTLTKAPVTSVDLVAGVGVVGDVHAGPTVRHRSRVRVDPNKPNLRQVHLTSLATYEMLTEMGIDVRPGSIGENVCLAGVQLLDLPTGTVLRLGAHDEAPLVALTGLRNPCVQLDALHANLKAALAPTDPTAPEGIRHRAGVFAVVLRGGRVNHADAVTYTLPPPPHAELRRV